MGSLAALPIPNGRGRVERDSASIRCKHPCSIVKAHSPAGNPLSFSGNFFLSSTQAVTRMRKQSSLLPLFLRSCMDWEGARLGGHWWHLPIAAWRIWGVHADLSFPRMAWYSSCTCVCMNTWRKQIEFGSYQDPSMCRNRACMNTILIGFYPMVLLNWW